MCLKQKYDHNWKLQKSGKTHGRGDLLRNTIGLPSGGDEPWYNVGTYESLIMLAYHIYSAKGLLHCLSWNGSICHILLRVTVGPAQSLNSLACLN